MTHPGNDNTGGKEKKIFKAEIVLILILTALLLLPQLVGPVKKEEEKEAEKTGGPVPREDPEPEDGFPE